jgi:hypothetical protein
MSTFIILKNYILNIILYSTFIAINTDNYIFLISLPTLIHSIEAQIHPSNSIQRKIGSLEQTLLHSFNQWCDSRWGV